MGAFSAAAAHTIWLRHPVRPTLIFLDWLKADAEDFLQFPLAQADRLTFSNPHSGTGTGGDDQGGKCSRKTSGYGCEIAEPVISIVMMSVAA